MEMGAPAATAPLWPLKQPARNNEKNNATDSHTRVTVFVFLSYFIGAHTSRQQSGIIGPAPVGPHVACCLDDQSRFADLEGSSSDVALTLRLGGPGVLLKVVSQDKPEIRDKRALPCDTKYSTVARDILPDYRADRRLHFIDGIGAGFAEPCRGLHLGLIRPNGIQRTAKSR